LNSSPPRYRALATRLADALRAGHYPPGSRLPSVRQLCSEHRVSLATATHALHQLEDAGLIEARPRLGFYARAITGADVLATPAAAAMALHGRRKRVIELATTRSDCLSLGHLALPASLLPLAALKRLLGQQLRADSALLAEGAVRGTLALREQLALRSRRMGCHFDAEDVVVTQGDGESLELCLRLLTKSGDVVAVASPAPLRALEVIAAMGLRVLEIPAPADTGLSVPALAFALQHHAIAACIVEPSFDRSTGSQMSDAAKQALATLAAQHQLPLIECDLLGELASAPQRPRPLKAFDRDDRVLYCGSLACITGTGFSVGHVVSGRHRLQLLAAHAVHGELTPMLIENTLAAFIASAGFDAHLRRLRKRLAEQLAAYREAVLASFPPGTKVSSSAGAYVMWVELPGGIDAATLLEQARREGYGFVPGAVFSLGASFDHCLRLTAAHSLDAVRARGIRIIGELACRLLAD
jgi:DNA-binding transcriptional MocR family regulator